MEPPTEPPADPHAPPDIPAEAWRLAQGLPADPGPTDLQRLRSLDPALPPEERAALWSMARSALIWVGFVAVLPWATFFVPARVVRAESNAVAAGMLLGYLLADVGFAMYLTRGNFGGTWQAAVLILGFLIAGLYNFVACDFVANRVEDSA